MFRSSTPDFANVFIHRSIKTRIETYDKSKGSAIHTWFLYIDPLKQGLKLNISKKLGLFNVVFIHRSIKTRIETEFGMTLQQALQQVFIHRSIKKRIETN